MPLGNKFRVWDGKKMHYDCTDWDFYIDMDGDVYRTESGELVFPMPDGIAMRSCAWESKEGNPLWESDVIRDPDGFVGVIIEWREEGCWAIDYCDEKYALAEFPNGSLRALGNIHQHPDWKNWDAEA